MPRAEVLALVRDALTRVATMAAAAAPMFPEASPALIGRWIVTHANKYGYDYGADDGRLVRSDGRDPVTAARAEMDQLRQEPSP